MDYEVFLLSRIVELHEQGCSDDEAVVAGAAALGPHHHLRRASSSSSCSRGFVAGKLLVIKETGVALASRSPSTRRSCGCSWCPATMTLLGAGTGGRRRRCAAGTSATASPRRACRPMSDTCGSSGRTTTCCRPRATTRSCGMRSARRSGGPASRSRGRGVRAPEPDRPPVDGLHRHARRPIDRLLAGVQERRSSPPSPSPRSSVPADAEPLLHKHFEVGDGGDWEWMWTTTAPPPAPGESVLVDLERDDLPEVQRLLEVANPTTRRPPGTNTATSAGWAYDTTAGWSACAVMERAGAGRPHLAGITVHPSRPRARPGPGDDRAPDPPGRRARTVSAPSACSPSNDVARRLYHGLGYVTAHAVVQPPGRLTPRARPAGAHARLTATSCR